MKIIVFESIVRLKNSTLEKRYQASDSYPTQEVAMKQALDFVTGMAFSGFVGRVSVLTQKIEIEDGCELSRSKVGETSINIKDQRWS